MTNEELLAQIDERFDRFEKALKTLAARIDNMEKRFDESIDGVTAHFDQRIDAALEFYNRMR